MENEFLLKLADHLKNDGYNESSKFIKLVIGNDGNSGMVKSLENFFKENNANFSLASMQQNLKVTEFKNENGEITFKVGLNIEPNSIADKILSGIILVGLSSLFLGLVEEDK